MNRDLPSGAGRLADRHSKVWAAYEQLGEAVAEGGPLDAKTRRLVKLALAIGCSSEGAVHSHVRRYLASNAFSNADCAVIPYILRLELIKLSGLWQQYPQVSEWWARVRSRPSVKMAIFDRMTEQNWALFRNLAPDPWPKVQALLTAA